MTDEEQKAKEARLPTWARNELTKLRADLRYAKERLHAMTVPGGSDVALHDGLGELALPPGSRIRFYFDRNHRGGHREYIDVGIRREADGPVLDVSGGTSISIAPRAGNVAYITVERLEAERVKLESPTEKVIIVARTHPQAMQLAYELGYRTQGQQFRHVVFAGSVDQIRGLNSSIPYYVADGAELRTDYGDIISYLTMRGHKRLSLPKRNT